MQQRIGQLRAGALLGEDLGAVLVEGVNGDVRQGSRGADARPAPQCGVGVSQEVGGRLDGQRHAS